MALQGNGLNVLQTIADIQKTNSFEVDDLEIAEELELDLSLVKNILNSLAQQGYVTLEKVETLSGIGYTASLTSQGEAALREKAY